MRFSSPSLRLPEGCVGEALHIGGRSGETSPFDFVLYDADPRVDLEEIAQTSAQSSSAAPRFAESRVGVFAGEALHINAPIGETLGVIAVWLRCSARTLLAVPDHGTGCRRTCRGVARGRRSCPAPGRRQPVTAAVRRIGSARSFAVNVVNQPRRRAACAVPRSAAVGFAVSAGLRSLDATTEHRYRLK